MAYDYDVQYTLGQDIGHADAMSRLRFKDDEDDLVAVGMATFEKPVIDAEKRDAIEWVNKADDEPNPNR